MAANIIINVRNRESFLSKDLFEKLKTLFENNNYLIVETSNDSDMIKVNYSLFMSGIEFLQEKYRSLLKSYTSDSIYRFLDTETVNEIKENLFLIKSKNSFINFYYPEYSIEELEHAIYLLYQITELDRRACLLRDLNQADEDLIKDIECFMSKEEINSIKEQYSKYKKSKDIDKMSELLRSIQKRILEEWKKIPSDIENMNDDNFKFIGHSVISSDIDGDFRSRYICCSLYTEEINVTFHWRFGFVMPPNNIVGASSYDFYSRNAEEKEENLLSSTIPIINHPERIIKELRKRRDYCQDNHNSQKIYSEVIIDGFNPVGIFCFTNGALEYDNDYVMAQKLKGKYPRLPFKVFDVMKLKSGYELENMQFELINSLIIKLTSLDKIESKAELSKYQFFFNEFNKLKEVGNYNSEDIKRLFLRNLDLLKIDGKSPDELFSGKYSEEEIRFVLGKNKKYNIDSILNEKITAYSLIRLGNLAEYTSRIEEYYPGISQLISIVNTYNLSNNMVDSLNGNFPLTFSDICRHILTELKSNLDDKKKDMLDGVESANLSDSGRNV